VSPFVGLRTRIERAVLGEIHRAVALTVFGDDFDLPDHSILVLDHAIPAWGVVGKDKGSLDGAHEHSSSAPSKDNEKASGRSTN
jgi:hypothetical protein